MSCGFVSWNGSSVVGFVTLGFGVCAGRGSVGSVWGACVMGVTGVVAVFLRYFGARALPDAVGGGLRCPHICYSNVGLVVTVCYYRVESKREAQERERK